MDGEAKPQVRGRLKFVPPPPGPAPLYSAAAGLSFRQSASIAAAATAFSASLWAAPSATLEVAYSALQAVFWSAVAWKALLLAVAPAPRTAEIALDDDPPSYTVLAALYREAPVAAQLVRALERLDYPRRKLDVLLLLEPDDQETAEAIRAARPPRWMRVVVCPPGSPKTKPRALNVGLALARGEHLVVYDAEDAPDPLQLREAAARFRAEDDRLVCLQAPLRIRPGAGSFYERQFAAEYAALFEVVLPATTRLGLPFPLGGTSNHFRTSALRAIGGWDPANVTEDADLGFRMAQYGWRTGVLTRPTTESAPKTLKAWLPQRARWLKGYLQTWIVHTRGRTRLSAGAGAALHASLLLSVAAAAVQAPVLALLTAQTLLAAAEGVGPAFRLADLALLGAGWAVAAWTCKTGANRSGRGYGVGDALLAPVYWAQTSLALPHAVWQLITRPTHWDKTDHEPDLAFENAPEAAGRLAA